MPSKSSKRSESSEASEHSGPRVALILGSGSARGYAHIGVIDELTARGYQIVAVSGSSMGALVGGLYASGHLPEFTEWAESLTQGAVLRLLDPSFTASGVLRAGKILDRVREMVGKTNVEDLRIPFTAVATDLIAGKPVWLQCGPLDDAIRASIAIPGLIAPHMVDGRLLADGGILDPLPIAPVTSVHADLTVAVNLSNVEDLGRERDVRGQSKRAPDEHPEAAAGAPTSESADSASSVEWLDRMLRSASELFDTEAIRSVLDRPTARAILDRLGIADAEGDSDHTDEAADDIHVEKGESLPKLGTLEVMNRAIDITQAALTRHRLAAYPPTVLMDIPRNTCRSLDFHRADEVIEIGRTIATQVLDEAEADPSSISH